MSFPDVEDMIRRFLLDNAGGTVENEIPDPRPAVFTRVWRSGGYAVNRALEVPVITIEAWDLTFTRAHDRLQLCRDFLLHNAGEMRLVRRMTEMTGPYRDPDPDSGSPRYSMSIRPHVRAQR